MLETNDAPGKKPRGLALHWQILIGLLIGAAIGITCNFLFTLPQPAGTVQAHDVNLNGVDDRLEVAINIADPVGRIFLRLVLMVVLPLVCCALALGVYGLGDVAALGRIGLKTLVYTILLSLTSVVVGLTFVNVIRPGESLSLEQRESLNQQYASGAQDALNKTKQAKSIKDILLDMIPENPLQEMVGALDGSSKGNGMLAVMFTALIFGVAMSFVPPGRVEPLVKVLEAVFDVTMVIIGFAMRLAPFGVACLVFAMTARLGFGIVYTLFWFVVTVIGGLGFQLIVVYSLALWFIAKRSPLVFFQQVSEAMLTAFGTSSSNATLPTALRVAQENLGISKQVSQFVLTIGSTGNQNGTALYEGVVVLFLAQIFKPDITLAQQLTVVFMSVLAGVGTAGVPGGSLPLIVIVLQTIGIPAEGIGIILGVDRLLDMCRTVLNVTGDLTLAACVASGEPVTPSGDAAVAPATEPGSEPVVPDPPIQPV